MTTIKQIESIDKISHVIMPHAGHIIRKETGEVTGNIRGGRDRYLSSHFDGINMYNHRRIYEAYHNVTLKQTDIINHINHDTFDNRIENLEKVTSSQNAQWTKLSSKNTSGYKGVSFDKCNNKWKAHIKINGKSITLGSYKEKEDAIKRRKEECIKLNKLGHKFYMGDD